jgi:hypothetical protein
MLHDSVGTVMLYCAHRVIGYLPNIINHTVPKQAAPPPPLVLCRTLKTASSAVVLVTPHAKPTLSAKMATVSAIPTMASMHVVASVW